LRKVWQKVDFLPRLLPVVTFVTWLQINAADIKASSPTFLALDPQ